MRWMSLRANLLARQYLFNFGFPSLITYDTLWLSFFCGCQAMICFFYFQKKLCIWEIVQLLVQRATYRARWHVAIEVKIENQ
jgi:hypothetical protein